MSDSTRLLVCYLACLKVPKTIEKPFVSIFWGFEGFFSYIDPSNSIKLVNDDVKSANKGVQNSKQKDLTHDKFLEIYKN